MYIYIHISDKCSGQWNGDEKGRNIGILWDDMKLVNLWTCLKGGKRICVVCQSEQ